MHVHLFASIFLPRDTKQIEFIGTAKLVATLALLLLATNERVLSDELRTSTVAALFAGDESVLSENTDAVLRRVSELPSDQQFDALANWLLPSASRSEFQRN